MSFEFPRSSTFFWVALADEGDLLTDLLTFNPPSSEVGYFTVGKLSGLPPGNYSIYIYILQTKTNKMTRKFFHI